MISEKEFQAPRFLSISHAWNYKSKQDVREYCVPELSILSVLKLPSCRLVLFIDMKTYILPKDMNCKTFLEENYAITLDSCDIFTKKMLKIEFSIV